MVSGGCRKTVACSSNVSFKVHFDLTRLIRATLAPLLTTPKQPANLVGIAAKIASKPSEKGDAMPQFGHLLGAQFSGRKSLPHVPYPWEGLGWKGYHDDTNPPR